VPEILGAEVLGTRNALVKVVFFRTPRSFGVENSLGKFEVLRDVGKEDEVLEIRGLVPVGEMFSLIWGSGAELEVRWETFGLPAVGSGIFMKLPALASFSFVFLGACGVPTGVNVVAERFTGFGVTTFFRPTTGVRGAGERCLLAVLVRWRDPEFELLSLAFKMGLDVFLERSFGTVSTCFILNLDALEALVSCACTNNTRTKC
jgi:hypothetical protein